MRRSGDVGCCVDMIVEQLMRFGGHNAMEQRVYCTTDDKLVWVKSLLRQGSEEADANKD